MGRDSGGRITGAGAKEAGRRKRRYSGLLQLLAAASLATFGLASTSEAVTAASDPWTACTSGLNVTGSPGPGSRASAVLYAVSAESASDAWAVGALTPPHGPSLPLLEHWNGSTWSQQTIDLPSIENVSITMSDLDAVVTFSPTDAWAGGQLQQSNGVYVPVLLHWNGTDWELRQFPVGAGALNIGALAGTGGGDLWVGEQSGGLTSYLAHDNGVAWSLQSSPITLLSLISFAPNTVEEGGLVGEFVGGVETGIQGEIAGYQNGQWSLVVDPESAEITDISGTGPNDVWAVGLPSALQGENYELQHYTGSGWTNIAPAMGGGVVTSTGVDNAEAVLSTPFENDGTSDAVQVSDPDGSTVTSLSMTPIMWDPSWGAQADVRAISATPRGAVFAVGSVVGPGPSNLERGIVYRDCST